MLAYAVLATTLFLSAVGSASAGDIPCMQFFCAPNATLQSTAACRQCADCRRMNTLFCKRDRSSCTCERSVPSTCAVRRRDIYTQPCRICYIPEPFHVESPILNGEDSSSLSMEVSRFWENAEEDIRLRNLTLNAVFGIKDVTDCAPHPGFSRAKLLGNSTCFTRYKIAMPSIDYTTDDNYYYDDHQNPVLQFDKAIFDSESPIVFWLEVRLRRLFHLSKNMTIFFEYPNRSANVTFYLKDNRLAYAEEQHPRSANESDWRPESSMTQSTQSPPEGAPTEVTSLRRVSEVPSIPLPVDTQRAGFADHTQFIQEDDQSMMHDLLTKYFFHLVIAGLIALLMAAFLCGLLVWYCCTGTNRQKFSVVTSRYSSRSRQDSRVARHLSSDADAAA